MYRNRKLILVTVTIAAVLAAAVYADYVLVPSPSPCAGVATGIPTTAAMGAQAPPLSATSVYAAFSRSLGNEPNPRVSGPIIPVVAAENFWGSLVAQLGGSHVNVTSIITDPNVDPHEYQSNDSTAVAFHNAQYVILNNVGYDSWASALLAADGNPNQTVLNVGNSLGVMPGAGIVAGNPHLWYSPTYVNQTVAWMLHNLSTIAPSLHAYFAGQYSNLTATLATMYSEVGLIHHRFAGTVVASTESIFVYLANATGLDLVSPPALMQAVAEGNDPPVQSVVQFECQLESGHVKVLVYNSQTNTPLTNSLKGIGQQHNVTVMGVTETIVPPSATFQGWMGGELNNLYLALDAAALGR